MSDQRSKLGTSARRAGSVAADPNSETGRLTGVGGAGMLVDGGNVVGVGGTVVVVGGCVVVVVGGNVVVVGGCVLVVVGGNVVVGAVVVVVVGRLPSGTTSTPGGGRTGVTPDRPPSRTIIGTDNDCPT